MSHPLIKTYREAVSYLLSQLPMYQRVGPKAFKTDLSNILQLCQNLQNPERGFQSIHIAGTNGKGSVSHILAAVLQKAGYKTGLYTSPHYKDFRERIKINGQCVTKEFVIAFLNKTLELTHEVKPSFFELSVAMAFNYFREQEVDIAVIETGLGGRLDSTNIIQPILSVITNIGYDHTQFLGDTLELIASEKAGIIKEATPVVIGESQKETREVFINAAKNKKAPIIFADRQLKVNLTSTGTQYSQAEINGLQDSSKKSLKVNLLGRYQAHNLTTALVALNELKKRNWSISEEALQGGLENIRKLTGFSGRMQILGSSPTVLVDSAHNREGMKMLIEEISFFPHKNLHVILATVNDKNPENILSLLPKKGDYYFSKAKIPRGMDAGILKKTAQSYGLTGNTYPSVKQAFESALKTAGKDDLILVCGSIFTVAEVL